MATTRPKERLYIYSKEYPKITDSFLSSGKLNSLLYHYGLNNTLVMGDSSQKHSIKHKPSLEVFLKCSLRKKIDWKRKISLNKSSEKSWGVDPQNSEKDFGKLFHLALSKVKYKEDIDKICLDLYLKGICSNDNRVKLIDASKKLLSDSRIQVFFDDKWEVKNEREILTPDGETYIPDRLLISNEKTIILDYKTGNPKKQYTDQIIQYSNILLQMGYLNVEKYLIYTNTEKLVYKI